jgi:hypothetical protein
MIDDRSLNTTAIRSLVVLLVFLVSWPVFADSDKKRDKEKREEALVLIEQGKRYRKAGQFEAAREACRKAHELGELRGLLCLAVTLAREGKFDPAF